MDPRRSQPEWFRKTYRRLAVAVMIGLAGTLVHELYKVPMPNGIALTFAFVAVYGAMAFVGLQWIGVGRGYIAVSDAALYTLLFVVMVCVGLVMV